MRMKNAAAMIMKGAGRTQTLADVLPDEIGSPQRDQSSASNSLPATSFLARKRQTVVASIFGAGGSRRGSSSSAPDNAADRRGSLPKDYDYGSEMDFGCPDPSKKSRRKSEAQGRTRVNDQVNPDFASATFAVNSANFKISRQTSPHLTSSSRRPHPAGGDGKAGRAKRPSPGSLGSRIPASKSGSLELGSVLGIIHTLLSEYEVKFTLQLLEDFTTSQPATYILNASVMDFAQELQRFTDSKYQQSTDINEDPINVVQSIISQMQTQPTRGAAAAGQSSSLTSDEDEDEDASSEEGQDLEDSDLPGRADDGLKSRGSKASTSSSRVKLHTHFAEDVPAAADKSTFKVTFPSPEAPSKIGEISVQLSPPESEPSELDALHGAPAKPTSESQGQPGALNGCKTPSRLAVLPGGTSQELHFEAPEDIEDGVLPNEDSDEAVATIGPVKSGATTYKARQSAGARSRARRQGVAQVCVLERMKDNDIDLDDVSMEQAAFLSAASDSFVVHPNNKGRVLLDLFVLTIIIVECVTLPLDLAFSLKMSNLFHGLATVLFTMDLCMAFTTGYYHHDLLIMQRRRIVRNYAYTWFTLDFTALFPWEQAFSLVSGGNGSGTAGGTKPTTFLRMLKLGKLLRVVRLLRLSKISALIKRLQSNGILPPDLSELKFGMSIVKMFVVFGLLSHWAACIWGWIGNPDNIGHPSSNEPLHILDTCTMGGPCEVGIEGTPWRHRYGLDHYDDLTAYVAALQYAASLITGGDSPMQASHPLERLFAIFMMIFSVLVNSMVVGEILLIMNRVAEMRMDFDDRMHQAREFMTARNVPTQLQIRVYRYLETQEKIQHGHSCSNRQFMSSLTDKLQTELVELLNSQLISQHPFFSQILDANAFLRLCLEACPVIYAPNENVLEKGAVATCAHFIVMGKVRIEDPVVRGGKVLYLKPPSWLGDMCLFAETLRKSTVTAVILTETLTVDKADLEAVCEDSPSLRSQFLAFRAQVLNDKMDALMCPICHDIGHCEDQCPQKPHNHQPLKSNTLSSLGLLKPSTTLGMRISQVVTRKSSRSMEDGAPTAPAR